MKRFNQTLSWKINKSLMWEILKGWESLNGEYFNILKIVEIGYPEYNINGAEETKRGLTIWYLNVGDKLPCDHQYFFLNQEQLTNWDNGNLINKIVYAFEEHMENVKHKRVKEIGLNEMLTQGGRNE